MRTGHEAPATPQTPPERPGDAAGDNDSAAAGDGPGPVRSETPPPPAAAPRPLNSLRISWGEVYEVAACVMPGGGECWTAVRLDGSDVFSAPDWVTLGVMLHDDHGACPQARGQARPDWQLDSIRTKHPGFAVIAVPGGWRAFRGTAAWPSADAPARFLSVLGNILCDQEAQDARQQAAGR